MPSCGLTLNATRMEIVSPGYPREYIFALVCVWNISVPSDMMVMITFADFETDYNFNYLRIHDGFDRNSSFVTYTGDNIPSQIIFVSNEIHIMFNSDHNKPRRGFNLTYHAFKKPGHNKEIYEAFTDSQDLKGAFVHGARIGLKIANTFNPMPYIAAEQSAYTRALYVNHLKITDVITGRLIADGVQLCVLKREPR
ncbi:unnamed protein product [Medioppia subpectinata]|uniref:CUB domain-containing protein n=1 Tax=Medioppia subpectinata TaxID=1979941 RepID=A0A7R9KW48_9ACAR|nr:unnamed protein product [Medioppia subpectinata]CAG2109794.1 unnamed protein product [Medioppia subpectinata]